MQAIVKNPIADPYILGISSGASLGATVAIFLGVGAVFGSNSIGICAFIGAFLISILVQITANIGGRANSVRLLLAGTALGSVCSAFSNFVVYIAGDRDGIQTVTFWLMGSLAGAKCSALLARATEPEYGPSVTVNTAEGLRALPYAGIEYLECTHHIVHFHLTSGEDVPTLSLRVPFSAVAQPLLADGRFLQPHRSYVVNLAEADLLSAGELRMRSGARISIPRGREGAVRDAFQQWVQQQKYSLK